MKSLWLKVVGVVVVAGALVYWDSRQIDKMKEDRAVVFVANGKEHRVDPQEIVNIYPLPTGCMVRLDKDMLTTDSSYESMRKKWKGE